MTQSVNISLDRLRLILKVLEQDWDPIARLRPDLTIDEVDRQELKRIARWIRDALSDSGGANSRSATNEELRAQRRSWVAGEAAFGNDAEEAAYRAAYNRGDKEELVRLDAEAEQRRLRALRRMQEMGL